MTELKPTAVGQFEGRSTECNRSLRDPKVIGLAYRSNVLRFSLNGRPLYELPAVQALEDTISQRGVGARILEPIESELDSYDLQIGGFLFI